MTWSSYRQWRVARVARLPQITLCVRNTKSLNILCVFYYLRNVGKSRHSCHALLPTGALIRGDLRFRPHPDRTHACAGGTVLMACFGDGVSLTSTRGRAR